MHDRNSATIGIITVLPAEFTAVRQLMDDDKEDFFPGRGAGRQYVIGRMPSKHGGFHTLVLCMADMANNAASLRTTLLLEHCKSVDVIIMTGIAGGVPNPTVPSTHVRLGDIVVSNWKGVIQYDMTTLGEVTCNPRPPSSRLQEAVKLLEAEALCSEFPWEAHIVSAMKALGWKKPPQTNDQLYNSVDPLLLVNHPRDPARRGAKKPRVFSGTIASANELLKEPAHRDALRDKHSVRAVEMETSGVADATWNHDRGYFAIRGICDYCDSHKNYDWQPYAAIVAAAYTRALIESIPASATTLVDELNKQRICDETITSTAPGQRLFFDNLIQAHTKLFAGREEELHRLLAFVRDQGSGYVFVEGPSGYGKTSLLAKLVQGQPKFAYHFISQAYKTVGTDFDPTQFEPLLANLCEQLDVAAVQPGDLRSLRVKFQQFMANPPPSDPIVVVIDAIDEIDRHPNYLLGLLPRQLPSGVIVILSARTQGDRCYLSEVGLDRTEIGLHLPLPGLNQAAIEQLLAALGSVGVEAAQQPDFVSRIHEVSEGDPFYLRFLVEDVGRGLLTADNIEQVPQGLSPYLDRQFSQLDRHAFRPQHREILDFVLDAKGPLARTDLLHLVDGLDALNFDNVLKDIHRFLLVHDNQYTFCHRRFAEYFRGRDVV